MARSARAKSKTSIYHIMLRGIDRRDIFLDDEDRDQTEDFMNKLNEDKFLEYVVKKRYTDKDLKRRINHSIISYPQLSCQKRTR